MAQAQDLRQAVNELSGREGPMLSAFLNVDPTTPENQGVAYGIRLRNAMDEIGVPEELQYRVREVVEEEWPQARTMAIFADENGLLEVYRLQVDLPETYRWGDPYLSPLVLVLDEHEPYGAAVLDARRLRYFVISLVQDVPQDADVVTASGYKEVDYSPSRPYPRGARDLDEISRRSQDNVGQFYNEVGEMVRDLTFQQGVQRLIVAGPGERVAEFRSRLPEEVKKRAVAEVGVPLDAPDSEIIKILEETREEAEHERRSQVLAEIRESGVSGLERTIEALQVENRVYHLALLWELEGEIRWSDADQMAVLDITSEKSPYSGETTRVRPLQDVILDLAAARGARVDFFRGENENTDVLRDEFGGVAGRTRF